MFFKTIDMLSSVNKNSPVIKEWEEEKKKQQEIANTISSIEKKYKQYLDKHLHYEQTLPSLYQVANNLKEFDNRSIKNFIENCLDDISIADKISDYNNEIRQVDDKYPIVISYKSFYYTCLLYDKFKMYDDAIKICKYAVDMGFNWDGTVGGMMGRLSRLIKKRLTYTKKIDTSIVDKNNLYLKLTNLKNKFNKKIISQKEFNEQIDYLINKYEQDSKN